MKFTTVTSVTADNAALEEGLRALAKLIARAYMEEQGQKVQTPSKMIPIRAESKDSNPESRRLLDVRGLSSYLSLPIASIYTMVALRKIPENAIVRLGRALRFDIKEIDAWVDRQKASNE